MNLRLPRLDLLPVILFLALAPSAVGELLVYEPFDYPVDTDLDEAGGAAGTTGNWTDNGTANHTIQTADPNGVWLGIPADGYPNQGGFVDGDRIDDNSGSIALDSAVVSSFVDGTTTWMSFVSGHTNDGALNDNHHKPNLAIGAGVLTDNRAQLATGPAIGGGGRAIGNGGGVLQACFWDDAENRSVDSLPRLGPAQQLIVMKIEWGAESETVSLFNFDISTDAGYTAPSEAAFDAGAISTSTLTNY